MNETEKHLLNALQRDTAYATGCTDPIGIALAAAAARTHAPGKIQQISIEVSPNIFKNAMGVGIPGTMEKGIDYAAAMGIVAGDAAAGLDVLNQVSERASAGAAQLLQTARTTVDISTNGILLYISVRINTDQGWAEAVIEDNYDHVVRMIVDGKEIHLTRDAGPAKGRFDLDAIGVNDVFDFAENAPLEALIYLKDGAKANRAAAQVGIDTNASYGLGKALSEMSCSDSVLASMIRARAYTAAASDARMAGLPVRIMAVAGSGNHGITSLLSVLAVWEEEKLEEEKLVRALALSALMTIYIKWHVQRMSAFCGCAVAAATGAAAGITHMLGGSREDAAGAMASIMGSLTGMICDGAKETCSYKVSVAAGEAVLHSYFALKGICVQSPVGILSRDLKESFVNMGKINDPGMKVTDAVILEITKKIQEEIMDQR